MVLGLFLLGNILGDILGMGEHKRFTFALTSNPESVEKVGKKTGTYKKPDSG